MKKIRWGLVSAGRIAHTFAQDMALVENAEITAVAARNLNNAKTFAQEYGIGKTYEGYRDLFDDTDVDAVYISTPHTFHFEHTEQALLANKHVLCEKPFTVSPEQCQALTKLAHLKQKFLMEAMWTWFLPAIKQAQAWLKEGRIGDLVQIQADFGYPIKYDPTKREWDSKLGGGCMLEMGTYPVAFNWLFTKEQPKNIRAYVRRADNGAESHVVTALEYENVVSSLGTSFTTKLRNWAYLFGTEGYIAIPDFWRATEAQLFHLDECIEHYRDDRVGTGFEFQIQEASQCILEGNLQSDVVTHEDSLAFQTLMANILSKD